MRSRSAPIALHCGILSFLISYEKLLTMRPLLRPALKPCSAVRAPPSAARYRQDGASIRHFHASRPNQLINEAVVLAHDLLDGVHSVTGLPWAASIPLTAILVRLTIATPLQIWSVSNARKIQKLSPLMVAWGKLYQGSVLNAARANGLYISPGVAQTQANMLFEKKRKAMYKRWKVLWWTRYMPLLQLPVWLAMMESIRRMVGMSGGLLSIVQGWVEGSPTAPNIPVVQSFSTEGALWFTDLLAADPYGALPVILSAAVFTNVTWGWKVKTPEEIAKMHFRRQRILARVSGILKRSFQFSALLLWPVMTYSEIPAGMLIYWISSTVFATAQTQIIPKVLPGKPLLTIHPEKFAGQLELDPKASESEQPVGRISKIKTLSSP